MGYAVIPFGRIRVFGYHFVAGPFANLLPVQQDAKGAEECVLQLDGGGENTE